MKLPAALIEKLEQADQPQTENYLRYTKLEPGKPANIALLEVDPFAYYLVWATAKQDGGMKPFRFLENPTEADIALELGTDYTQSLNFEKTGVRKPELCLTWPIYNWDAKCVQVLEVSHASLRNRFAQIGLNKKYSKNLLSWDFELTKTVTDRTRYDVMPVPRDEDEHDENSMDAAWALAQKKGFDLQMMLTGGDPFNPQG